MALLLALAILLAALERQQRLIDAAEIREALRLADISIAKAVIYMSDDHTGKPKDRNLLERQLKGDGHLRHTDLCKLPLRFWQFYILLMFQKVGMPREMRRAVILGLALRGQRRMQAMSLPAVQKEQVS